MAKTNLTRAFKQFQLSRSNIQPNSGSDSNKIHKHVENHRYNNGPDSSGRRSNAGSFDGSKSSTQRQFKNNGWMTNASIPKGKDLDRGGPNKNFQVQDSSSCTNKLLKIRPCCCLRKKLPNCGIVEHGVGVGLIEALIISVPIFSCVWIILYYLKQMHGTFNWKPQSLSQLHKNDIEQVDFLFKYSTLSLGMVGILFVVGGMILFISIIFETRFGCMLHLLIMLATIGSHWTCFAFFVMLQRAKMIALQNMLANSTIAAQDLASVKIHYSFYASGIITSGTIITVLCLWFGFCSFLLILQIHKEMKKDRGKNKESAGIPRHRSEDDGLIGTPGESLVIITVPTPTMESRFQTPSTSRKNTNHLFTKRDSSKIRSSQK